MGGSVPLEIRMFLLWGEVNNLTIPSYVIRSIITHYIQFNIVDIENIIKPIAWQYLAILIVF